MPILQIKMCISFPWCPVFENLPSNAGDVGSIPGLGTKIPRAVWRDRPLPRTNMHVIYTCNTLSKLLSH